MKIRIGHFSKTLNATSETFISSLNRNLEGEVISFHGGSLTTMVNGKNVLGQSLWSIGFLMRTPLLIGEWLLSKNRNSFFTKRALRYQIKNSKLDILLIEYGHAAVEILDQLKGYNIPVIVHFHGFDAHSKTVLTHYQTRYLAMFQRVSMIISKSNFMTTQLIQLGADEKKIALIPSGATEAFFKIIPDFSSNQILAVGRLVDKKGPLQTLMSFSLAVKERPELRLEMIGDGPLKDACYSLINFLNLQDKVIMRGECSHQEVLESMSKSFCFVQHSVQTSFGDAEGTPNSIMEASASGLPVVATSHAGIQDVIVHEKTGILVNEGDTSAMGEAILNLAQNRSKCAEMGRNGKNRVANQFSSEIYHQKVNDLITSVLKKSN